MILILYCFTALILGVVLTYICDLILEVCECLCGALCSVARFIKKTICERKNETEKSQKPIVSALHDPFFVPMRIMQQGKNQKLTFRQAYTIMEEELKRLGVGDEVKRQRGKCCYGWSGRISAVVFDYKNGRVMEKEASISPKHKFPPRFAFNEQQMKNIAEIFAVTCATSRPFTDLRV